MNNVKKDLDDVLDDQYIFGHKREYIKYMMLSDDDFIDAYSFYGELTSDILMTLLDNNFITPLNKFGIYVFNTASGQYIVPSMFSDLEIITYKLSYDICMKVIRLNDENDCIYITNDKSVIIFYLEQDKQNKTFKINNKDVIPSPLIKKLSDQETENILALANAQYTLHVLTNN